MQFIQKIYRLFTSRYLLCAVVATITYGAYYGIAAVSIPSIALASIAVIGLCLRKSRHELLTDKEALMIGGVTMVFFLSGLISEDTSYWANRLYHSTAYLYIPLGIAAFRPIDRQTLVFCVLVFVFGSFISAAITGLDYVAHFDEYNRLYNVGKTIPTPIIHVRYSFLLALASICGLGVVMDGHIRSKWLKGLCLLASISLFMFVHILAVRTGLLSLYGALTVLIGTMIYREGKWKHGIAAVALVGCVAVVSILAVPSLRNKIDYMLYDLKMFETKVAEDYSDNLRLTSIMHGGELFLEHPLFGVGIGNIRNEMYMLYEAKTPEIGRDKWFAPISQVMYWLASFGLVGTVLIIGFLLYPLIQHWRHSYLIVSAYACAFFSMLPETMFRAIETKALILVVVCLTYEYLKDRKTPVSV